MSYSADRFPTPGTRFPNTTGPVGTATSPTVSLLAAANISGERALMFAPGGVMHADPTLSTYEFAGISASAAMAGSVLQSYEAGVMSDPAWSWSPGMPIYVAPDGVLTQTCPSSGTAHRVGIAMEATAIIVSVRSPVVLAQGG